MNAPLAFAWAVAVWWTSNTVGHHFIHRPFFRRAAANRLFGATLSVAVGYPQRVWRERHLAHHAGVAPRARWSSETAVQSTLVFAWWALLINRAPEFFLTVYLPGFALGLVLCALHGHYEHAAGTISHYGRFYNAMLFNDGYHVEHHAHPGVPWWELPARRDPSARSSAWPAPLRWLDAVSRTCILDALERLVLRSHLLQRFVLTAHERALGDLLGRVSPIERITIVGGGLFPRTALILGKLLPSAQLTVVDSSCANLARARAWPGLHASFIHACFKSDFKSDSVHLVIIPLAFDGDREAIYRRPPAPAVIVHDWLWRPRGTSRIVSLLLLKRVNLITRCQTGV